MSGCRCIARNVSQCLRQSHKRYQNTYESWFVFFESGRDLSSSRVCYRCYRSFVSSFGAIQICCTIAVKERVGVQELSWSLLLLVLRLDVDVCFCRTTTVSVVYIHPLLQRVAEHVYTSEVSRLRTWHWHMHTSSSHFFVRQPLPGHCTNQSAVLTRMLCAAPAQS